MNIVRSVSTRGEDWIYLDFSRRSIAQYLFYVQMAQGERLRDEQIMSRLRILVTDIKENKFSWKPNGMDEDRANGTTVKTDRIFQIIYFRLFLNLGFGTESEAMKKIRTLEEKAEGLYKSRIAKGM